MRKRKYVFVVLSVLLTGALLAGILLYENDSSVADEDTPNPISDISERNVNYSAEERYIVEAPRGTNPNWTSETEVSLKNSNISAYEVTRYPGAGPTNEDLESAWRIYNQSYEAARDRGMFDYQSAIDDGYKEYSRTHYINEDYYFSNRDLNPDKPEGLIYLQSSREEDRRILVGYVYIAKSLETEGEQVAGPLSVWHYHPTPKNEKSCFAGMLNVGNEFEGYRCPEQKVSMYRSPEMIHVWFVKHPRGPFSMGSTGLLENTNITDGVPEKMTKKEFITYVKEVRGLEE